MIKLDRTLFGFSLIAVFLAMLWGTYLVVKSFTIDSLVHFLIGIGVTLIVVLIGLTFIVLCDFVGKIVWRE